MKVRLDGRDVEYVVSGAGPWVTLVHALGCNLEMWWPQLSALERCYTVLRYDIRGHGGSSPVAGPYSFPDLAADGLNLLDHLGVEKTHFVGLSLGGMIGQHLALTEPGRLLSLTLASTTSRYPAEVLVMWAERLELVERQGLEPLIAPTLARWFTPSYMQTHPEVMDRIGGMIRGTSVAGYQGCGYCVPRMNLTARLAEIALPCQVLVGEQDVGTPPAMAREIARTVRGAQLAVIAQASHLCNIEQADAFNRLLRAFLDGISHAPVPAGSI